ncbi:glycosyltransferase family 2 protein [Candidatus Woesearchaeota archaeon]|nr:glycosyltransferase family 2 protein [Candidatus Woesearchaeota archaeon]
MTRPLVSIIVPNYQGKKIFPDCIETLLKQNLKRLQIVFVDDCSTDGSFSLAKQLYGKKKNMVITKTSKNCGYVGAMNHGLRFCTGKYVMTSNNDITYPKNWAREMYRVVKGKKKVIGAGVHFNREPAAKKFYSNIQSGELSAWNILNVGGGKRQLVPAEKKSGFVETVVNGIIIVPRDAINDVLFLPNYFAYGEDIELCWRLRSRGYKVVLNTRARLNHLGGYTRKVDKNFNKKAIFHGTKNTIQNHFIFYEKKNVLKLLLPFLIIQTGIFFARPRQMFYRLKAYGWVLSHPHRIWKYRQEMQRRRTVSDEELFHIMTYKFSGPEGRFASLFSFINILTRHYYKLVGIKTFDIDGCVTPKIDVLAVQYKP